ncbi:unnamed protein product [Sphenostylis stenocarpa]|uniref:Uncharacterized protein n=1 Tax=Sphenostylis stenocarpa TaxID=92480 RepID=A0AA86W4V7_9FABA|nr:unnamed protein product [Sphenostylis stenocarpa]
MARGLDRLKLDPNKDALVSKSKDKLSHMLGGGEGDKQEMEKRRTIDLGCPTRYK